MFFSIIIPVYNVEYYITECVNSVLEQIEKVDAEIILVDDGSSDKSGEICDYYDKNNIYIRVIHQENSGLSAARNAGIAAAIGDYVVLLDADDYLQKFALVNLKNILEKEKYDIVVNRVDRYDEANKKILACNYAFKRKKKYDVLNTYKKLLDDKRFVFAAWDFVVRRQVLIEKNINFVSGLIHEDEVWTHEILINAESIFLNFSDFYVYRINRDNSIMQTVDKNKIYSLIYIFNFYIKDLQSDKSEIRKKICGIRIYRIYLTLIYSLIDYLNTDFWEEIDSDIRDATYKMFEHHLFQNMLIFILFRILGYKKMLIVFSRYRKIKKGFKRFLNDIL